MWLLSEDGQTLFNVNTGTMFDILHSASNISIIKFTDLRGKTEINYKTLPTLELAKSELVSLSNMFILSR